MLSGYLDSALLLKFTQIDGQPPAIVLTGRTTLNDVKVENQAVEVPYTAELGQLDVQLTEINLNKTGTSKAALRLLDAEVVREGDTEAVLSLPRLSIDEMVADPARQNIALGAMVLNQVKASLRRETDGRLDLAKLFSPAEGKAEQAQQEAPPKQEKGWTAQLGSLELTGAALRFEDRTLPEPLPMVIDPLDLNINNIDFTGARPLQLVLNAVVNERGRLETNGSLAWAPFAVDLAVDAKEVDLVPLQGWAGDRLNVLVSRGAISFEGNVKANETNDGRPLKFVMTGKSRLTNFNVFDEADLSELIHWRSVDINGIEFVSEPLSINASSIVLADFFANVVITPEGQLNLKYIVRQEETTASPAQAAAAVPSSSVERKDRAAQTAKGSSSQVRSEKVLPLRIGRIVMQGGNINFNDRFIKPNYQANLTGLAGRVGPLDPRKRGEIDVRGAVDKTAPLNITGKFSTFGKELYLDVTASAKGIDMPEFSPYSGKYVGYAIEKGKLSVDVHYHVEEGELTAENHIFLDQLTFGEKVESPDALSIPVKLALAMLKNRRGEIDVRLPISGSINDPEFSIGGVLVKAVLNLLTKAATAPFAMLGSLFGGGEELSEINFSPGEAQVTPGAEERLQTLSKALWDRPALDLEITGWADPPQDSEALKQRVLERKIKAEKLAAGIKKGVGHGSLDDVGLTPEEYEKYLTRVYKEAEFEKPKNLIGLTKSLPVPEMEKLMLANIDAGEAEMQELAHQRADAARDWLIEQGGISGERIFVLQPQVSTETDREKSHTKAEFSLR